MSRSNRDILVSVLMCVYNTPVEFLREAVNSILNQTYQNTEFVIVEDCSDKADTRAYIEDIAVKCDKIRLYHNEKNLGLTRSLNVGLLQCKGDYIARMDADDISLCDRIEKQVSFMESNKDVALCGGGILCFGDGTGQVQENKDNCSDDLYRVKALIEHPGPAHPTFMFRSSFLRDNDIRYNEEIVKGQDYEMITRILRNGGNIRILGDALLKYRVHEGQITASSELEQLLYQSRTSFEYLSEVFPDLSEGERTIMSTLGWYDDERVLRYVKGAPRHMEDACKHLTANIHSIEDHRAGISAIKKAIKYNRVHGLYDRKVFEEELGSRWWKRALRMSKVHGRSWIASPFTLGCYRYLLRKRSQ